ncbi:hypothetical protein HGRIS_011778 [Hohenbuehelia grisea]|uniref:Uncharacterized protein n=1 Tax=Hohenbuehelia grisea TaxID=104357 RepID=A0ABR3JX54_9AGAR
MFRGRDVLYTCRRMYGSWRAGCRAQTSDPNLLGRPCKSILFRQGDDWKKGRVARRLGQTARGSHCAATLVPGARAAASSYTCTIGYERFANASNTKGNQELSQEHPEIFESLVMRDARPVVIPAQAHNCASVLRLEQGIIDEQENRTRFSLACLNWKGNHPRPQHAKSVPSVRLDEHAGVNPVYPDNQRIQSSIAIRTNGKAYTPIHMRPSYAHTGKERDIDDVAYAEADWGSTLCTYAGYIESRPRAKLGVSTQGMPRSTRSAAARDSESAHVQVRVVRWAEAKRVEYLMFGLHPTMVSGLPLTLALDGLNSWLFVICRTELR